MASASWTPSGKCPADVDALREELKKLAKLKKGKQLISDKFTKDHVYAGHEGAVSKLAASLAKLREKTLSTFMISSMDATAQEEVLNWIQNVAADKLTLNNGTWTVSTSSSTVPMKHSYKFATVDLGALKGMNKDDVVKKSRKWLTESTKTPKLACQFDSDGTPLIYHLDY